MRPVPKRGGRSRWPGAIRPLVHNVRRRGLPSTAFALLAVCLFCLSAAMTAALALTGATDWMPCLVIFLLGCAFFEIADAVKPDASPPNEEET
ncbi:hypothetical protein ASE04_05155 [Rhizobium sp. Root708]|nr:hypothetical protein ASE04_05155 [Rhizobium sp. Root708]